LSRPEAGFTLVELLVVISVIAVIFVSFATFFTDYIILYSKYQQDATAFSELASQSQRISDVLRGTTDIVSAAANDLTVYAYFAPNDTYVSLTRYYVSGSKVLADITPMTANPPTGSPITASKKTYTILSNYYQPSGSSLFSYFDASNTQLTVPVSDEHSILQIGVNLAEPGSQTKTGQNLNITVSLRNRKTNL
jgi:prepilin-type N-terminal cleavage/methylation domain-containing protein